MRLFTFLLVFSLFSKLAIGQATSEFNSNSPDLKLQELLTFQAVNKIRSGKKLDPLLWDDVLYRAARDHADFLVGEKGISHFQKNRGRETPSARIKLHGGFMYTATGENIVMVTPGIETISQGKKINTLTYESIAEEMASLWKHSPHHYKNIISNNFNYSALAIAYDQQNNRLIAVQVFGFTPSPVLASEIADYSDELLQAQVPKLPFGLRKFKGRSKKNDRAVRLYSKLKVDRDCLTGSFRTAKKIFRGRRSGIAQEFIPLTQFDSTSQEFRRVPNRRNGLFELNGTLQEPIYKRQMLKSSRRANQNYLINTRILRIKKRTRQFIYPLNPANDGTQYNAFLIKQKQLQTFRWQPMVPGDYFETDFPYLDYKNSFRKKPSTDRYNITHEYDTIDLQVFFPSSIVSIDQQKTLLIRESFNRIRGKIVAVEAEAFASVEGNEADNDRLANARLENFMSLMRPYLDTANVESKVIVREQWDFFHEQIKENNLSPLKSLSNESLRAYVNVHAKDSIISSLLDAQRYTRIKVIWRIDHIEVIPGKSALQAYEVLRKLAELVTNPKRSLLDKLEQAQLEMYYELSQSDTIKAISDILIREHSPEFQYHDLVFRYTVQHSISDKAFYDQLHTLTRSKYFPIRLKSQAVYNNLVLIYQSYIDDSLLNLMPSPNWRCRKYRQSEFLLKKLKKIKCRPRQEEDHNSAIPLAVDYYILKEIPALIQNGQRVKVTNFASTDLWRFYYLYTIINLNIAIPLHPRIPTLLPEFKQYFHPNDALLTDEERLKYAYFYCAVQQWETARNLVKPLALRDEPHKEALQLYLSLIFGDYANARDFSDMLIREFPRLGKGHWCNLLRGGRYLNFLLLEDYPLKRFYNCNCDDGN